jgi:tRNA threonylcarbamoyladenosine biosynthesis protein TsaB
MTAILAIETATDACSVALYSEGLYKQCHEVLPRQHNQRLFSMLSDVLPRGNLRDHGVEALVYGCGPGSFTGLRIAASAVQGLAFTVDLPVVPVSTLACQAATALRLGLIDGQRPVVSILDARINEIYWALFTWQDGLPCPQGVPIACPPERLAPDDAWSEFDLVGSGCKFLDVFSPAVNDRASVVHSELLPEARDLVPLALPRLERRDWQRPAEVQPVYVRDEISWKKLAEQGRPG